MKQRLTYDQLLLTQFIQGFTRNIIDEKDQSIREHMLWYLHELMEDATDFTWSNAKAAHAVLLCEMEKGSVSWKDTNRIDRICRAHTQKHSGSRQNWGKSHDTHRKPWFCKPYETGQCQHIKDHEYTGKIQRHICSSCLAQGHILSHPEKDCQSQKRHVPKNE